MFGQQVVLEHETFADSKTFHNLYDEHIDILYRFFYSKGVRPNDVENLVQNTLVLLWVKRKAIRAGRFKNYMLGIAYNLVLEYQRGCRQESLLTFDDEQHSQGPFQKHHNPLEIILTQEDTAILREAMNRLPSRMRKVIELIYFEEYTPKATSEKMGISLSTVYGLERRALKHFRRRLRKIHAKKSMNSG